MIDYYGCDGGRLPEPIRKLDYTESSKSGVKYINLAISFDIETSSFTDRGEPRATMYVWQMDIAGTVVIGRTWEEFKRFILKLRRHFRAYSKRHLIIYVHNLAYEFTWIRRLFSWDKVFSIDTRRPIYAVTSDGIEFRCSYLLSGYSLEVLANNLTDHKVRKLVGDLDYQKIHHSSTILDTQELKYCINDVKIVTAYIEERMAADGNISLIPLTKTGYVRQDCKRACLGTTHRDKQYRTYRGLMKMLVMDPVEYQMAKDAFAGGFTHANAWKVGKVVDRTRSKDFTSSYPTSLIAFKYPMSRGVPCKPTLEEFKSDKDLYCWIMEIDLTNVHAKIMQEHYISEGRCLYVSPAHDTDNGRIVWAAALRLTITNVDYDIIRACYDIKDENIHIIRAYRYRAEYLPRPIVDQILAYYEAKTKLKGVDGKEAEYLEGKERVNSIYGMMATDPVRDLIEYDEETGQWERKAPDLAEAVDKINQKTTRFSFYPWAAFCTAYSRRNLWTAILELNEDYCYSDTDSVKYQNPEKHEDYFQKYNEWITEQLQKACDHHKIEFTRCSPKTVEGVPKPLGVWDDEGMCRFKTLGAKRYMTEKGGKITITVAGLNKSKAVPYLLDKYGKDGIFDAFEVSGAGHGNGMKIPKEHSGRLIMTYLDFETSGTVTDYLGNDAEYHELTSVHMEPGTYELTLGQEFYNYLEGLKEVDFG